MEFKELKKKTKSELHNILAESRDKLRDLRFKDANKQLKNVREIREVRETIAQALTLLNSSKQDPSVKLRAGGKTEGRKQQIVNSK
ncbi:MAG: 50S ribosomal protein L29 [Patescibacteria group bacterium]